MNRLSQIFGAAIVIAIAVVFIVQFRPNAGPVQSSGSTCAVEVRGSCISSIEFHASRNLLGMRTGDENRLRAMGYRRLTAEGLYERWLLNEDAERLGISVSDDELTAELAAGRVHVSLPADKIRQVAYALNLREDLTRYLDVRNRQTNKFDTKQYEKQIRAITKMSPSDFRDYQKKELVAARMRDIVRARVRVGESEAFEQFSREKSTRTLSYVRFDRRFYTDLIVDTSDKAIQAWADANKEELDKAWEGRKAQYQPECRVVRDLLVEVKPEASEEGPEAAKAAARTRIEKAVERLKKGESFADVARSASDDPSASRGGELGCVTKGRLSKPVEDKLLAMKPGEVSDIIETEDSFHVIKLEQIAKDADAEKIGRMETARELYMAHEAERLAAEAAKQVLAAAAGGKSLEDALSAYLAQLTPAKAAEGRSATAAGAKPKDQPAAAKADGGEGAKEAGKPEAVEARAPYTIATHPNRPAVEASLPFNVSGSPIADARDSTEPARLAFQLDKPGDLPKDVVALENGYAVIQLKEKSSPSQEQWEKDREFYTAAMRAAKQNDALIGYMRRLKSTIGSELKYDQALLKEPKPSDDGSGMPDLPPGDEGE
ncbi:foldase [Sorangium cellulosum]|uniref:Periplasmic chaperone PpiD n=1 Tax=Sorangium cellulosum TaxID=56 RepID=A0A2L0ERQ7_SORCE|nr:peptidylprolyl isomerase [Sorangium cellulosum]AUX41983.1 foldase [Sorangium cellulosum]